MTTRRSFLAGAGLLAAAGTVNRAALAALPEPVIQTSAATAAPLTPPNGRPYDPVVTLNGWTAPWRMRNGVKEFHLVAEHNPSADFDAERIPSMLRDLAQWVCWKYIEIEGRPTKCPFRPVTGIKASSTDATTWTTFKVARAAYARGSYEGVGFVFAEGGGLTGIDLDECIDDRPDGIGFACRAHAQDLEPLGRAVLALLACMAGQQLAVVGSDNRQFVIDLSALLHGQGDATRRLSDTALVKLFRLLRLARRLLDLDAGAADPGT